MELSSSPVYVYRSASGAPPSNAQEGALWYQTDTEDLLSYDGASWNNIGLSYFSANDLILVKKIPLVSSQVETTSESYVAMAIQGNEVHKGHSAANYWTAPTGWTTILKFYADLGQSGDNRTAYARLYDTTASAEIAGSELTYQRTAGAASQLQESGEITLVDNNLIRPEIKDSEDTGRCNETGINVYIKKS